MVTKTASDVPSTINTKKIENTGMIETETATVTANVTHPTGVTDADLPKTTLEVATTVVEIPETPETISATRVATATGITPTTAIATPNAIEEITTTNAMVILLVAITTDHVITPTNPEEVRTTGPIEMAKLLLVPKRTLENEN